MSSSQMDYICADLTGLGPTSWSQCRDYFNVLKLELGTWNLELYLPKYIHYLFVQYYKFTIVFAAVSAFIVYSFQYEI